LDERIRKLLDEIAMILRRSLDEHMDEIERITSRLEVDAEEYKDLMVAEVAASSEIIVGVQFAFPPMKSRTPEELKEKAIEMLEKKLRRDLRLY